MRCRQAIVRWLRSFILLGLSLGISVTIQPAVLAATPTRQFSQVTDIVEVSPPETIQKLRAKIDRYHPQVRILSPAADQLLKDDSVAVRFDVKDLPIFKDAKLGLGPHLSVLLDNQPAQAVYDLSQPLVFEDLAPGTHTIRAVATRPWDESFKNTSAFAQTTFHVFTKTAENNPATDRPLLTYGQPQGVVGTDTVLIDFFLSNLSATDSKATNWQAQVSINGSTFPIDQWQSLYVQGLKPGKNWVQMQLTDRQGRAIDNAFNDTIRVVELQENGNDTLSKLTRGDLSVLDVGGIVDPNYTRPQPLVKPAPATPESATPKAEMLAPVPAPVLKQPAATPKPQAPAPKPAPTKSVAPPKPAEATSPEAKNQPGQKAKPTPPAQIDQKPATKQAQEKVVKPAPSPAPLPVETKSPTKAKGADSNKTTIHVPVKPPAAKAEKGSPTSLQSEKAVSPSKQKQPQPKSPDLEKTAPAQVDTSAKTKATAPKPEPNKVSPAPSPPTVKAPVPSPPAAKSATPQPNKEKSPTLQKQLEQPKSAQKEEDATLQTNFTKFWQQIRPEPPKSSPSTSGKQAPTPKAEPKPVPSPAPKTIEPKSPPTLSKPSSKQAAPTPQKVQPSPPSTNRVGTPPAKAQTPALAPSQQSPARSQTTTPSPSSSSQSAKQPKPSTPKVSGSRPQAADSPEKPQLPAQKAGDSGSSVFSIFRDRLQQLQKSAVPAQKPTPSAPPKATPSPSKVKPTVIPEKSATSAQPKTPQTSGPANTSKSDSPTQKESAKPSVAPKVRSQPSALSTFRDRWQQQKQLMSPKETAKPALVKPAPQKTTGTTGAVTIPPNQLAPARPSSTPATPKKPAPSSTQKPSVTEPTAKTPVTAKSAQPEPTDSMFSSLRSRWQQQKQLIAPTEKAKSTPVQPDAKDTQAPATGAFTPPPGQKKNTPAKSALTPAAKKTTPQSPVQTPSTKPTAKEPIRKPVEPQPTTAEPAKSKPTDSVFSSLRTQWQQQKQLMAPTEKAKPTPIQPNPEKTPSTTGTFTPPPRQNKSTPTKSSPTSAVQKPTVQSPAQNPSVTPPIAKPAAPKSSVTTQSAKPESTDSVFSSLRSRWQQQKQLMSPAEQGEPTQVKPVPQKSTGPTGAMTTPTRQRQLAPAKPSSTPVSKQPAAPSKPSITKPTAKEPVTVKSIEPNISTTTQPTNAKPTESVFSSLRDRWQQQVNQSRQKTTQSTSAPKTAQPNAVTKQAKSSPPTTPSTNKKPSTPQSTVSPSGSPSLFQKSRAKVTTSPTVSSSKPKVSSSAPSSSQRTKKTDNAGAKDQAQKSESTVFDPGVYYRRFLSSRTNSGQVNHAMPPSEKVNSIPTP